MGREEYNAVGCLRFLLPMACLQPCIPADFLLMTGNHHSHDYYRESPGALTLYEEMPDWMLDQTPGLGFLPFPTQGTHEREQQVLLIVAKSGPIAHYQWGSIQSLA